MAASNALTFYAPKDKFCKRVFKTAIGDLSYSLRNLSLASTGCACDASTVQVSERLPLSDSDRTSLRVRKEQREAEARYTHGFAVP